MGLTVPLKSGLNKQDVLTSSFVNKKQLQAMLSGLEMRINTWEKII